MSLSRRNFLGTAAASAAALMVAPSSAGAVTAVGTSSFVLGFPPGSGGDTCCRLYAEAAQGNFADTIVVENAPGAGGRVGVQKVMQSPADGSALLFTPLTIVLLYPHVFKSLGYEPFEDFVPVTSAADLTFALGVGPAVPESVTDIQSFLAWAEENPDKATVGNPGIGTPQHLLASSLADESGLELTNVAYKGSAAAATDVLGGQVAAAIVSPGNLTKYSDQGVRVLAVTSPEAWPFLPDVPTMAASGFAGLSATESFAFLAPKGTPANVVSSAESALVAAGAMESVDSKLRNIDLLPSAAGAGALAEQMQESYAFWKSIVEKTGFEPM